MSQETQKDITADLYAVEEYTLSEDRVKGVIEEVNPEKGSVKVRKLTDGETFYDQMGRPDSWTSRHKFVQLIEDHGYSSATATDLVGDEVRVDVSGRFPEIELQESIVRLDQVYPYRLVGIGFLLAMTFIYVTSYLWDPKYAVIATPIPALFAVIITIGGEPEGNE